MNKLINYIATILFNTLLLTFSWQQNEHAHLQIVEYNMMEHDYTTLDIDLRKDLEFIVSRNSSQGLLGALILNSDQKHNSSTIYENFIFTDGQQLDKQSHYMAHLLGYQLIQPYNAPPVHTLLQWLSQNPKKKIHALAFNHPICPAWHYLLTIIYPEGKIQLDAQACNPQSLTWPLNSLIMEYLDQKIMQRKKPLQVTRTLLDLFLASHAKKLTSLEEENQILQNKLHQATKALTYVPTQILHRHTNFVSSVAFFPNGERLATSSWNNTIHIYDAKTYQLLKKLENKYLLSVTFSPDGKHLLSRNGYGLIHIYDAKTYQLLKTLKDRYLINELNFSPNGKILAFTSGKHVHLYNTTTYQFLKKMKTHTTNAKSVIFSPDGNVLVSADAKTIDFYYPPSYILVKRIEEANYVKKLAFSFNTSHNKDLACIIGWLKVHIYRINTYHLSTYQFKRLTIDFEQNRPYSIAFSPKDPLLAVGSGNGNIYLYNTTDYKLFKILKGHTHYVTSLIFSSNGTLASGSGDKSVRIWKLVPSS